MVHLHQSTKPTSEKSVDRKWHLIDVKGKRLGRICNDIAIILQGKQKVSYSNNIDMGDEVVVINAKYIAITGKKAEDKKYTYFSGYPGGLREISFNKLLETKPTEIIRHAVMGKLPKNKLRNKRIARLHIYPENQHAHADKIV